MTDLAGNTYLIDLTFILTVIGILIAHFYHASLRVKRCKYILILSECVNVILLLYWFNLRHSGLENMWNNDGEYMRLFWIIEIAVSALFIYIDFRWREKVNELSNDSISEAILNLPAGLCFSEIDGQIVLENMKMQDIWYRLAGEIMTDANEAWEYLESAIDEEGLIRLDDGTVWNIERENVRTAGHVYLRTKADDVTGLHHLYKILKESNEALDLQNRKTRQLLLDIAKINEEEERLDIQRKIHHEIGQCIISANRYLTEGGDDNVWDAMLSMWERVFRGNTEFEETDSMENRENEIIEAAQISGCDVHFAGIRPRDEKQYSLYLAAVREAVTNAIWHGQAENVYVNGNMQVKTMQNSESGDTDFNDFEYLLVTITNDGKSPEQPIKEGVGLGKLREKLIRSGIRMEILWKNGMELKLYFN